MADLSPIDGPTWVYAAFCEHNGLLYVGVARDVPARIKQHRKDKPWWRAEVADVVANLYPTRREALAVEAHYIAMSRPLHNIAGQSGMAPHPHEVPPHRYSDLAFFDARGKAC